MSKQTYRKVAFFIVAHADDWQLFMQPAAYQHIVNEHCKTVFIILTAGDAGKNKKYWRAREEGMKNSIRFCLRPEADITQSTCYSIINNHKISAWTCHNTIAYFMRLPDGGLQGKGFQTYKNQSVQSLMDGKIKALRAVDQSTSYSTINELSNTLGQLIITHKQHTADVCLHFPNPYPRENPGDHPDHITLGKIIKEICRRTHTKSKIYNGYSAGKNNFYENQNPVSPDLFWKIGMFAVYEQTVFDLAGYSTIKEDPKLYIHWCLH